MILAFDYDFESNEWYSNPYFNPNVKEAMDTPVDFSLSNEYQQGYDTPNKQFKGLFKSTPTLIFNVNDGSDYHLTHDHEVKKLFVKDEQGTGPVSQIFIPIHPKVKKGRGWDSTFLRLPRVKILKHSQDLEFDMITRILCVTYSIYELNKPKDSLKASYKLGDTNSSRD
ncbi:hypothetical protein LXL04_038789 [Taraxacum kok-saghyz]